MKASYSAWAILTSNMLRMEAQPAYILHTRPYRETSLILELLTEDYGRLAVVARGVKRNVQKGRGLLQPFVPLLIFCAGRHELLNLNAVESVAAPPLLRGCSVISALYLNELLMRLLHPRDAYPVLFQSYRESLLNLEQEGTQQKILRLFEMTLLKVLGYELQLTLEVESSLQVNPDHYYAFDPERGPLLMQNTTVRQGNLFKGHSLLALSRGTLTDREVLLDAKRLMRLALALHLGGRPLETRKLFRA